MSKKTCICPFGDRCKRLAEGFARECGDLVALGRGGYIQIPPPDTAHLQPSPTFAIRPGMESLADDDSVKQGKTSTAWQQIQNAYIQYFQRLAKEGARLDENGEEDNSIVNLDSATNSVESNNESDGLLVQNHAENQSNPIFIALHHFHPKITTPMRRRQQFWDKTPVWQCLHSNSLSILLTDEEQDMIKQMVYQSNRITLKTSLDSDDDGSYDFHSYIVLPSYPIARGERDLERLRMNSMSKSGSKRDLTPTEDSSQQEEDEDTEDEGTNGSLGPEASPVVETPKAYRNTRISELHQQRDSYHETLLSFERMRRAAADERLRYLMTEWKPRYQTLVDLIREFQRVDAVMQSSCTALYNYTKSLHLLCTPKSPDDFLTGVATDSGAIVEPLMQAFSAVGSDWQDDLPHIKECSDDFENLRNQVESAAQQIQLRYNSLQHSAVADEVAIRQAWCELEELCIIDSEIYNRRGIIEDRWLRELTYRRLIVVEKTSVKSKLQPILDSVVALDGHCQSRIHEVLLAFLPKHRRLFLRTRELFDPAMDLLESGIVDQKQVEKDVLSEGNPPKDDSAEEASPAKQKPSSLLSVFGAALGVGKSRDEDEDVKIEMEMTKLGNLLKSVHIYEVQIVSFRVEQNTWVTSFCVITHQQYMHFFPLLPGTDFESLRKEARPALASACVAAWEKGSTPLLSVLLTGCSYGLSADGTFIELIITTPPRKKIGLKVGSKEECESWVEKTQRWVMMFSMNSLK